MARNKKALANHFVSAANKNCANTTGAVAIILNKDGTYCMRMSVYDKETALKALQRATKMVEQGDENGMT